MRVERRTRHAAHRIRSRCRSATSTATSAKGRFRTAVPGALARARLALDIVRERLALTGVATRELRFDLIGVECVAWRDGWRPAKRSPTKCGCAWRGAPTSLAQAVRIGNEVETLYTNGPAGGGGVTKSAREVVAVQSVLLPRELLKPAFSMVEA